MRALPDGFHFSIAISQSLWSDLLGEALPIQVGKGDWDLVDTGQKLLQVAESQVRGLLTGVEERIEATPVLSNERVQSAGGRLRRIASRGRRGITRRVKDSVSVRGTWRGWVSKDGSAFRYHDDGVTLDARAMLEVEGTATLFREQFEIPFRVTKGIDGTASLEHVRFNRGRKQLEGELSGVSLSVGDSVLARLIKVVGDRLLEQQVQRLNPLPLIPGSKLENMITPGEGPLKLTAGIEDLHVGINAQDLVLSVRFAFKGAA